MFLLQKKKKINCKQTNFSARFFFMLVLICFHKDVISNAAFTWEHCNVLEEEKKISNKFYHVKSVFTIHNVIVLIRHISTVAYFTCGCKLTLFFLSFSLHSSTFESRILFRIEKQTKVYSNNSELCAKTCVFQLKKGLPSATFSHEKETSIFFVREQCAPY